MLIQKLVEYAQHTGLADADPYFETNVIRWLVVIDPAGTFVQLLKLGDEKRGLEYAVPKKPGRTAGGVAAFGTDNPRFVLGYAEDPENVRKAKGDFPAFIKLINRAAEENPGVADFQAAKAFYADRTQTEAAWLAAAEQKVKDGDRVALAVTTSHNIPIFDTAAGRDFWRAYRNKQERAKPARGAVACLCCGRPLPPVLTSGSSIRGPLQGGTTEAMKVASFNRPAFTSYGWKNNENAAMCADCDFAFTQGLNHLLGRRNTPRTRIDQGGVAFAFWADTGSCGHYVDVLEDPNSEEALRILMAAERGEIPAEAPNARLYAVGLRGNTTRAVVVDWFETSLTAAYTSLATWFTDLSVALAADQWEDGHRIAPVGGQSRRPSIADLCHATACREKDVVARTSAALIRAALAGPATAIPLPVAEACLRRLPLRIKASNVRRSARGDDAPRRDGFSDALAPARLGLIRAFVNRAARANGHQDLEVSMSLNENSKDPAYNCGRLLALVESAQLKHHGGKEPGTTVVDRYYGRASSAPGLVFGSMMAEYQNWRSGIDNPGAAYRIDEAVRDVIGKLDDAFPSTLTIEQQGRFALGYYHQKGKHALDARQHSQDSSAPAEQSRLESQEE